MLQSAGYEVVGEAADGVSALSAVRDLQPDVVLLDVQLPDLNGFEVAEALAGESTEIVLISSRDATSYRSRLRRSRARGFIAKADLTAEGVNELLGA